MSARLYSPSIVVHKISVARGIDDAKSQSDAILFDDYHSISVCLDSLDIHELTVRDRLDFSGGPGWLVRSQAPL